MTDSYLYAIIPLLPLTAAMVVFQTNPYHALILRGILGAVAALIYGVLGAADVALTEALVGTMLAIMLYAVAVRSSLVMRLGVLETETLSSTASPPTSTTEGQPAFEPLFQTLRTILGKYYLRIEIVPFPNRQALQQALIDKEVHATCMPQGQQHHASREEHPPYQTLVRIQHLYDILKAELPSTLTSLIYISLVDPSMSSGRTPDENPVIAGEKNL